MNDPLIQTVLLGIIEGITEFLPISSTGHLLIAEKLGLGARSEMFNVVIQAGAILAVTVIYWKRLWDLCIGFKLPENREYAFKLLVAFFVTAILGYLLVNKMGIKLPETVQPVAWALILGGVWILVAEWLAAKRPDHPEVTWVGAIVVGVAQIVAGVFPGTSRSGSTIFAAMLIGRTSRVAATEFAFIVGIPTMYAASASKLLPALKAGVSADEWTQLIVGFLVSAIVAFAAVKWLLHYIQTHRFTVFAWYRIVAGAALLLFLR
jgi:undecaprenyl-diphosphatase